MESLIITEQDHGAMLRLHVGDKLTVRLKVIPGTGYSWWKTSVEDEKVINEVNQPVSDKSSTQSMGGIEQQVFCFLVKSSGVCQIELKYRRGWEKPEKTVKSFFITVNAED